MKTIINIHSCLNICRNNYLALTNDIDISKEIGISEFGNHSKLSGEFVNYRPSSFIFVH